jgi:hypothetical protein
MKRGVRVLFSLGVVLLLVYLVLAASTGETGPDGKPIYSGGEAESKARDALGDKVQLSDDATPIMNPDGTITISEGSVTLADGTKVDGPNAKLSSDGKVIEHASSVSDSSKSATDVEQMKTESNGDYSVGSVSSLSQSETSTSPAVLLTQATDVKKTGNDLCGALADSLIVSNNFHTSVQDFCVRGNRVDVSHAEEVQIKCNGYGNTWTSSAIDDASFVVDDKIRMASTLEQDLVVTDCAGNDLDVSFITDDGAANFTKDGTEMAIKAATVTFPESEGLIEQEFVQANGSARLVLDRLTKKVLYVEMEPYFNYEFRTASPSTDFSFRAQDVPAKLFIRRTTDQTVPQEFTTCKNCGVIDLPSSL